MAALTSQAVKDAYVQILHVDTAGGGNAHTLVPVKDGDNGTVFAVELSDDKMKATKAFIQTKKTADVTAATNNAVDVAGCNIIRVSAAANAVVIGGFANGVDGQEIDVVIIDATNDVTLNHQAAAGTQKANLTGKADLVKTADFGGWRLYCDGTNWFQIG
jgi:hypothetical protein